MSIPALFRFFMTMNTRLTYCLTAILVNKMLLTKSYSLNLNKEIIQNYFTSIQFDGALYAPRRLSI
jgi:hypothetical protein